MGSIVSCGSSVVSSLSNQGNNEVSLDPKTEKINKLALKINEQNFSFKNLDVSELKDVVDNLDSFKFSLQNRIELTKALVMCELVVEAQELLSRFSEKINFQIAKSYVEKASNGEAFRFVNIIDKFKLSRDHLFFLAKAIGEKTTILDRIEKFHLSSKRIIEIARRALCLHFMVSNADSLTKTIKSYLKAAASLKKSEARAFFDHDINVMARAIITNKLLDNDCIDIRSLGLSSEEREKLIDELLKTRDGVFVLSKSLEEFELSLEKREKIAYFLLNNNHREILIKNIETFDLSAVLRLKIVNILLKNKKTRDQVLLCLPDFKIPKSVAKNIYVKYLSIQLLDFKVLRKFSSLKRHKSSKNPFYVKNESSNTDQALFQSICFYIDYFTEKLVLSVENQNKLCEIFNKLLLFDPSNQSSQELLFRSMIFFLSKIAVSKEKNLSFLDDNNFFISMILTLGEVSENTKNKFIENVEKNKKTLLKDSRNYEPFINLLLQLYTMHLEGHISIENFVNQIFDPEEKDSPLERFRLIQALINLNLLDQINLETYLPSKMLIKILAKHLFWELGINEDLQSFETNIYKKLRDVSSLFTYLGKIKMLPQKDQIKMKDSLKAIVLALLSNTYKKYRKNSPHFKELLKKDKKHEAVIDAWLQEKCIAASLTTEATDEKKLAQNISFFNFLKLQLITNTHLENLEELFPTLFSLLEKNFDLNALSDAIKALRKKINAAVIAKNKKALGNLRAEYALLNACLNSKSSLNEVLRLIKIVIPATSELQPQFVLDMEAFIETYSKKDDVLKDCVFSSSGQFFDVLMLGKETGGCQNVDGDPSLNKHLLGIADGKNNVWSIKNKEGRFVSRAVARLLYSEKRKAPVIFLERVYSLNPNKAFEKALITQAKVHAKELKLPLFISGDEQTETLVSWGSSAHFEYSDSASKHQNNGTFTINGIQEVL